MRQPIYTLTCKYTKLAFFNRVTTYVGGAFFSRVRQTGAVKYCRASVVTAGLLLSVNPQVTPYHCFSDRLFLLFADLVTSVFLTLAAASTESRRFASWRAGCQIVRHKEEKRRARPQRKKRYYRGEIQTEGNSSMEDDGAIMKMDAINTSDRRPQRTSSLNAIKTLEQKLRKFFDEADGHGSLMRKPPPTLVTPQYFKVMRTISCYPIKTTDWIAVVNSARYKRKFVFADEALRAEKTTAALKARSDKERQPGKKTEASNKKK